MTPAQAAAIKADIAANPDLSSQAQTSDGADAIAALYNALAAPDCWVYRTNIPLGEILAAVTWANLTPAATPDNTITYSNRALVCQGKQINLQTMLIGQSSIDASNASFRAGLADALTNVPSKADGTTQPAGWIAIRDGVLARRATRLEKLLATGSGATPATAATLTWEGPIGYADVLAARNS